MNPEETVPDERKTASFTINLSSSYHVENLPSEIDINQVYYSNLAAVNVSHRDVFIDFLQTPGVRRDEAMHLPGVRIFMSYAAAQKLAETLFRVLASAHADGAMEQYPAGKSMDQQ